ncbi:hypothetical protein VA249_18450 [Vibrio alfacsensis]|nr:hypothetical protein VA249_18450 [Vibrio alfacsensis]
MDHLDEYVDSLLEVWFLHVPAPLLVYYFALSSAEKADVSWFAFPIIALTTPTFIALWERKVLPILIIAPLLFFIGYTFVGGPDFSSFYFLSMKWIAITISGCVVLIALQKIYLFTAWLVRKILSVTIFYNWFTMLISAVVAYQVGAYVFNTYEDTINLILMFAIPLVFLVMFFTGSSEMPGQNLRSTMRMSQFKLDGMSNSEAIREAEAEEIARKERKKRYKINL